jgi:hypothetical protein
MATRVIAARFYSDMWLLKSRYMVDGCAGLTISGWQPDSASKPVRASTSVWRSLLIVCLAGTHREQNIPWSWKGVCMPISSSRFDIRFRG